ncbi:hypothetical protein CkaCkLH20_10429 [Colletotrichum karsti]|uniref:Protein kinase domain-containing protein n=1 Tax=Colletotrichum karsti TaxID=1095194 RepID=A0A9P6HXW5_9PEZI|nr:uncharacterized protein CkaCkLH20_10429 [Colletotrichum karsti]KAF9872092.1 hypothetical protein CkaCkLH20_10429 [Colletotrichum karsti]
MEMEIGFDSDEEEQDVYPGLVTNIHAPAYDPDTVLTLLPHQRPQVVLVEVIEAPQVEEYTHASVPSPTKDKKVLLVAKIMDHQCYNRKTDWTEGPYSRPELVDHHFSLELAVYQHLYLTTKDKDFEDIPGRKKMTGASSFAPEFYGSWVIRHQSTQSDTATNTPAHEIEAGPSSRIASGNERFVGVILLEHIDGYSIRDYCSRKGPDGTLIPRTESRPGRPSMPQLNDRLEVLKQIIDGIVSHLHVGVTHEHYNTRDFLIVEKRGELPRVVKVGHALSTVWRWTREAIKYKEPQTGYMQLPRPIHPLNWVNLRMSSFYFLEDWYPTEWSDEGDKDKSTSLFGKWLLETFGEEAEDVPGYHYSVWSTYQNKMIAEDEAMIAADEAAEQAGVSGPEEASQNDTASGQDSGQPDVENTSASASENLTSKVSGIDTSTAAATTVDSASSEILQQWLGLSTLSISGQQQVESKPGVDEKAK